MGIDTLPRDHRPVFSRPTPSRENTGQYSVVRHPPERTQVGIQSSDTLPREHRPVFSRPTPSRENTGQYSVVRHPPERTQVGIQSSDTLPREHRPVFSRPTPSRENTGQYSVVRHPPERTQVGIQSSDTLPREHRPVFSRPTPSRENTGQYSVVRHPPERTQVGIQSSDTLPREHRPVFSRPTPSRENTGQYSVVRHPPERTQVGIQSSDTLPREHRPVFSRPTPSRENTGQYSVVRHPPERTQVGIQSSDTLPREHRPVFSRPTPSRENTGQYSVVRHPPERTQKTEERKKMSPLCIGFFPHLSSFPRTKSNQRWMKLRTTVQLSGAITTIQKKPPLKREDSFLKRFSTRQIPETQETVDTGDDGDGGPSSHNSASTRRRRRRRKPLPRTVVNPDENFFFYWLFVLTVCVLYNLWTLIVRQSFPELQSGATVFWYTCDGFSDAVFLLDIAVQFRTGYLEQGLMVYNSKKLAGHYIQSRAFLLDLSALLPLDLLQINIGVNPILRFPRFLKVYRIYHYYYMVESRTVYPNLWRVMNLIHILLILAHWFGCFYYLLSEAEGFQGDWVYPYRPGDYSTLTRKYLGSLYWSTLTLTTIGDLPTPETNAE
uniref:Ion transport domain-containing protein n=1 Tax=Timema monikensis TaxID=170555 RepID=A0A7R9E0Y4_9NEOP|nr:unnamed protein product [Timema monikensis]